MGGYHVPESPVIAELTIKNSRFIASVEHANTAAATARHQQQCQQRWPGASHYCTAAVYGAPEDSRCYAMSDAGEPSGTAGRPMLNVLLHSGLGEVSVVVVRYFGGVKLGTGGLQRAYSQAVSHALSDLPLREKILRKAAAIHYDYADQSAIQHLLERYNAEITEQEFSERVAMQLAVVADSVTLLANDIKNATQGRVALTIKTGD